MTRFRLVNLVLLADALAIALGLFGFLVARFAGQPAWVPVFGWVLGLAIGLFACFLAVGLAVGAYHTAYWMMRTILRKPPPDWSYD